MISIFLGSFIFMFFIEAKVYNTLFKSAKRKVLILDKVWHVSPASTLISRDIKNNKYNWLMLKSWTSSIKTKSNIFLFCGTNSIFTSLIK